MLFFVLKFAWLSCNTSKPINLSDCFVCNPPKRSLVSFRTSSIRNQMAFLPFYLPSHTPKGKFMSLLIGFSIAFRQQEHRIYFRFTFRVLFPDCLLNNKLITFLTRTKIKLKLVLFLLFFTHICTNLSFYHSVATTNCCPMLIYV